MFPKSEKKINQHNLTLKILKNKFIIINESCLKISFKRCKHDEQTAKDYVEEMKKVFTSNEAVMMAHYQGLNVNELDALRKEMRVKWNLF